MAADMDMKRLRIVRKAREKARAAKRSSPKDSGGVHPVWMLLGVAAVAPGGMKTALLLGGAALAAAGAAHAAIYAAEAGIRLAKKGIAAVRERSRKPKGFAESMEEASVRTMGAMKRHAAQTPDAERRAASGTGLSASPAAERGAPDALPESLALALAGGPAEEEIRRAMR